MARRNPTTGTVFVTFCMDTEGMCVDPSRSDLLSTWDQVDAAMDKLFDTRFRARWPDSNGGLFRIGWFFLSWTGFTTNPRGRAFGYHAVRDHYLARWGELLSRLGDEQCWHYHHPAPSGIGNEWGLDWCAGDEYNQIISRQILERQWFPVCYRAGGTIMTKPASRWVDAWFPFDYSNRAPVTVDGLVDWSAAPADWSVYHPAPEHFDRPGSGRRRMARCVDLETTTYSLTDADIAAAFERAAGGQSAVISCFDHDYRDIAHRVDHYRGRVQAVASKYPDVAWRYAGPADAIRQYAGAGAPRPVRIEAMVGAGSVFVWSSSPVFQAIPWLAIRTADRSVHHIEEHLLRIDETSWRWDPPQGLEWSDAAFAVSTHDGASATVTVRNGTRSPSGFLDRAVSEDPVHPRSIWEYSKPYPESCIARASGEVPEMDSVRQAREILAPVVSPGMRLLDVGCGSGHAWLGLKPLEVEYWGIDSYARGIHIGRAILPDSGLPPERLRVSALEDLPRSETYDVVLSLNTLLYQPRFELPLEVMARAARRYLVMRSSFGDATSVRYLPDVLLEPGYEGTRAYFSIFGREEVRRFLEAEGFEVSWVDDWRQQHRFGGTPEVVGGIPLPAQFLVARRVSPPPSTETVVGSFADAMRQFRAARGALKP
jgi:SAM-dependent methyltransferase